MTDEPHPPYPLDLLARAASILSPEALRVLYDDMAAISASGFGEVRLIFRDGRLTNIVYEVSHRLPKA